MQKKTQNKKVYNLLCVAFPTTFAIIFTFRGSKVVE